MIAVVANINSILHKLLFDKSKLDDSLQEYGINKVIHISEIGHLKSIMMKYCEEEIILISNFPPDRTYLDNNISDLLSRETMNRMEYSERNDYSLSSGYFKELGEMTRVKAVQFITGARKNIVSDKYFEALFAEASTSVKRKTDWVEEQDYFSMYEQFVVNAVKRILM